VRTPPDSFDDRRQSINAKRMKLIAAVRHITATKNTTESPSCSKPCPTENHAIGNMSGKNSRKASDILLPLNVKCRRAWRWNQ
jgi:hypothetical protein